MLCLVVGLNVGHRLIEFASELLDTIVDAVQVGAKADHLADRRRGFLDLGITHAAEPQLLSMEGCSIRTVDGRCRPKSYKGLLP